MRRLTTSVIWLFLTLSFVNAKANDVPRQNKDDVFIKDFYSALCGWNIKSWDDDYLRKSGYGIYSCGGTLIQRFIYHDERLIDVDAKWLPLYFNNYTNQNAKPQKDR